MAATWVTGRWQYDQRTQGYIRTEYEFRPVFGFGRALYDDDNPVEEVPAVCEADEDAGGESDVFAVSDTEVPCWDEQGWEPEVGPCL